MFSGRNAVDWRVLGAALIFFGACGYDPPAVGSGSTSSSSSSSSGKGGAGGAEQSSSSSSGDGGVGGLPTGTGGLGGTSIASVVSSSSGGGGMGGGGMDGGVDPNPIIQDCGGDCNTSQPNSVCCKSKNGGTASCIQIGVCLSNTEYALKCDDKADCGLAAYCCLNATDRATCTADCKLGTIICKTSLDCPPDLGCNQPLPGGLMGCGPL